MRGESGAHVLTHGRMLRRDEGCGDEMDTCVVDRNLTSLIPFPEWVNSSASHACNHTNTSCISLWSSINYLVLQQRQGQIKPNKAIRRSTYRTTNVAHTQENKHKQFRCRDKVHNESYALHCTVHMYVSHVLTFYNILYNWICLDLFSASDIHICSWG